jgi:hypothetical protein
MQTVKIDIKRPKLTGYQKEILYNDFRFTVTEASTKVGKTFSHLYWIFERAHEPWNEIGYEHWWVAPQYSQANIAFKRLRRKIMKYGNYYSVNLSSLSITCPNGSIITFKSADKPDGLFGEDVHSIVFDEAPRAKEDSFFALRSTITATRGKMKLIGNFGGNANWMHKLKKKSFSDSNIYGYFRVTAWDAVEAGILEREEIEQAQRDLPPKIFQALYMAEETESENMLLTFESINDLFTNPIDENKNRYITSDIAHLGSDLFTLFVWEGFTIIDYFETSKIEPIEVERIIKSYADKYKVGRSRITYDADGLGGYLRSYLKGAVPFFNGGKVINKGRNTPNYKNLKTQCGYEFAKRINDSSVSVQTDKIPEEEFKQELECLQSYSLDNDGKIQLLPKKKIKEIIGRSPDRLDGLIMREVFELKVKRFGKITA